MGKFYQYDLFISYATEDIDIAKYVVDKIEKNFGTRCFIAPRDIRSGADYAAEIVRGISNSLAVLLIFSSESDRSAYVLREVNSAVSRNKTIIPLRIENFLPSEAMEFYLGPTHWLDAFPQVLDTHLEKIYSILAGLAPKTAGASEKKVQFAGVQAVDMEDLLAAGWTKKQITLREIELDYLCVPADKFAMNDITEGVLEDWVDSVRESADTSCALMKDDRLIGYCDFYPVDESDFDLLQAGGAMIRSDMIALYSFGGQFDAYIAMIAIDPADISQHMYGKIFDWIFARLAQWRDDGIEIRRIGISVYQPLLEKFVKSFGFTAVGVNPAGGRVYVTDTEELAKNSLYLKRINSRCQTDKFVQAPRNADRFLSPARHDDRKSGTTGDSECFLLAQIYHLDRSLI